MKKIILALIMTAVPVWSWATGDGDIKLDHAKINLSDTASLQRGAHIFVNYCLSCHSARYMRYNRMGRDLGISDELLRKHMLFAADKVGDLMIAVMPDKDAKDWFGAVPPDLTLVARSRGPDWIYTYLRSFYRDNKSGSGWNNAVFKNVSMPHVLYEWQGRQRPVFRTEKRSVIEIDKDGKKIKKSVDVKIFDHLELDRPGIMDKKQFDTAMLDLTNFLVYLGDPAKLVRYEIGIYVLIFLVVFLFFAYLLKKNYWKDVE